MKLTDLFKAELEAEAFAARRVLERVPRGRNDWKPHPKSMTLGYLAALVARLPAWTARMIHSDEYDLYLPEGSDYVPRPLATSDELLQTLSESTVEALEALAGTTDEHLMEPWRMLIEGRVVSEQPRFMSISYGVFSHLAHHRGQLTVYLRLNDVPVPAIYGLSADERRIEPSLATVARAAAVNPVWSASIMDRAEVFLRF